MKLEVRDLERHFGGLHAVDGISFTLDRNRIYGFVGPNGAGKTTTMRIIATLDEPTSGDVFIDGVSILDRPEVARRAVGYMPDSLPAHQDITVHEYLDFFARAYGLRGASRRQVVAGVEDFTQLGELRGRFLNDLSKGMKQRVSLARAMVHDPQILVLDEPAAGLDPRARVDLRELLRALSDQGKAILISSHILAELSEICHGAVIIEHGKIARAGEIEDLVQATTSTWTVRLRALGDSADLLRAIREAPHVAEARTVGEEIEADLEGGPEASRDLLRWLVEAGQPLIEYRRHKSGLEDVFLQVTRGAVQ